MLVMYYIFYGTLVLYYFVAVGQLFIDNVCCISSLFICDKHFYVYNLATVFIQLKVRVIVFVCK